MFTAKELTYLPEDISLIQKSSLFGSCNVPIILQIQYGGEKSLTLNISIIQTDSSKPDFGISPIEDSQMKITIKLSKDSTPTYCIDRIRIANHNPSGLSLSIRFIVTPLSNATFFIFNYELYSEQPPLSTLQESVEVPA